MSSFAPLIGHWPLGTTRAVRWPMITICPGGWTRGGAKHQPPVVLKPEDGLPGTVGQVSHGMCAACKAEVDRELDRYKKEE